MKDKLSQKWKLLRDDLSTAKGFFCFACSLVAATFFFAALFTGVAFIIFSGSISQIPAHELAQLKSLTVAQVIPYIEPSLREYVRCMVWACPVMALACEISRSIRAQERKLSAA
ncbi:hypothetical protein AB4Y45_34535 [Paraburkholderia sp. EG287A]|uniref:hypothetical protein n=1 Tax=Paraburkholderia sp. EG287A TaxID=3237012 RepID=UPI0034D2EFA3